jgi:two-component system, LytTR family, sensor kinase
MTDATTILAAGRPVIDLTASDGSRVGGRRAAVALVWFGGWTAIVFAMAGVISSQKRIPFSYAVTSEAMNYYTLATASLAVWFASARMAAQRWSLAQQIGGQVALAVVLIAAWQGIYGAYLWSVIGPFVWSRVYRGTWMFQLLNAAVLYGAVLGATLATQAARRARQHERRQHELALLARDAEMKALTAQLEPHFLLNTLNSVMALMEAQPDDARRMLERLSELLKAAFDEIQEHDVALGRELDLTEAYLGIEQVRFADRLQMSIDAPDEVRDVRVPPFLLQPIVENAVKHGVAPFSRPGSILIAARRDGPWVRITISDSGPGFDPAAADTRGHGFGLAERRLKAFAPAATLHVERRDCDGRFTVVIALPA